jgi:hypothetical protein
MASRPSVRVPIHGGGVAVSVAAPDDVPAALRALGLAAPRPVIVVVGGAGALAEEDVHRLRPLFDHAVLPVAARLQAAIVDGGTASGVMRALGESRAAAASRPVLVGVAVTATVRVPEVPDSAPAGVALEPHHTHFVLVPGTEWGEDSPWLTLVARTLAGPLSSVTVVMNGGDITLSDVAHSVAARRPVLVVDGSGRAADALADALDGRPLQERLNTLAASGLLTVVPVGDPPALGDALQRALAPPAPTAARS